MEYIELVFAKLLANVKGHDAKRFVKSPAFAEFPSPTIEVTSPECGPSGSPMSIDHTQDGEDRVPALKWTSIPGTQEYLLVVQDVDVPIPMPLTHGLFYSIPLERTEVVNADFDPPGGSRKSPKGGNELTGGFRYGANFGGTVYSGPRALKGHGPHRYFFQIVALKEKLDLEKLSRVAKKGELEKAIEGKVLGWGEWTGVSERKF